MKASDVEARLSLVRERLAQARRVVVLTGAGISAESGVPTFRGEGGLWREHRAVDLATPEAFGRDPRLVWEFYNWRRAVLAPLAPNPGHEALVRMEERLPHFTLITQNIDGLHEKAGSRNILELHGNIWFVRCLGCGRVAEDQSVLPPMPRCTVCGELLRPHVVWFGEPLDPPVLKRATEAVQGADVMMVVGTSGTVEPAASMGMSAKRNGAFVVEINLEPAAGFVDIAATAGAETLEINLEPTPFTGFYDVSLLGKSGEILPRLREIP